MAKKKTLPHADTEAFLQKVGTRIRELRLAKGERIADKFALENDINRVQYGRYERGEDLRLSSLLRVLNALDVPANEFFAEFLRD